MRANWFLAAVLAVVAVGGLTAAEPPVVAGSWVAKKDEAKHPWTRVYDRVTAGETVWVSVGEDYPNAVRIDSPPAGVTAGVYKCYRENGKNVISQLVKQPAVSLPAFQVAGQFQFPLIQSGCQNGRCPVQMR